MLKALAKYKAELAVKYLEAEAKAGQLADVGWIERSEAPPVHCQKYRSRSPS